LIVLLAASAPVSAQSFGIGGRFSFMKPDVDVDADSQRFTGGHIRAKLSPHTGLEVSLDMRSETDATETVRIRNYPIQVSLLVFPVRSTFSPYLLGGGGWYSQTVETLAGDETVASQTVRDFGWHAGFGAELSLGKHVGIHADYRYTFLDFGGDDNENDGLLTRFLPSYRGSMWTTGFTVYF
jgi:opacity protein-like surface antigen